MAVNAEEVVALYTRQKLTMQQVADRLGVTKARIHQILKEQGVETGHGYRPRPQAASRPERAYRAYQMTLETRALIDRLAEALGLTRTAVVTRAVEELADRQLPGGRRAVAAAAPAEEERGDRPRGRGQAPGGQRAGGKGRRRRRTGAVDAE